MSQDLDRILSGAATLSKPRAAPLAGGDDAIRSLVRSKAQEYGIDPDLAERWAEKESGFNPKAKSPKGAVGVLQLMPQTASGYGVKDSTDPEQNIDAGMRYLVDLQKRFDGDLTKSFAAYNAGPDAVERAGGVPNYPETQDYVATILGKNPSSLDAVLGGGSAPAPDDAVSQEFAARFGDPSKMGDVNLTGAGMTPYHGMEETLPEPQQKTYEIMVKGGFLKENDAPGSIGNPYFMQSGMSDKDVLQGAYYVNRDGKLARAPGGQPDGSEMTSTAKLAKGFGQGLADVPLSLANLAPGAEDSELRNALLARQMGYDADNKGDLVAGLGRFTGQVAASAPALGAAELAVAPILRTMGPVGSFIAGRAGQKGVEEGAGMAARMANAGLKTASQAVSGAGEGVGATLLTSSANDAPLSDQLKTGAILGGALKPVGSVVTSGVRRFIGGPDLRGAAPLVEQKLAFGKSQGLPVEVPMTSGQITGAPGQQMAENALLRGAEGDAAAKVMQAFRGEQQEALRGNVDAITGQIAGRPVETGEGGRAVAERLNKIRDRQWEDVTDAYKLAREQGQNAMLASAKEVRDGMLESLRGEYDLKRIESVAREVEGFGANGTPTAREMFEARTRLSNLTQSGDDVEAGAAKKAVRAFDAMIDQALTQDLLIGDPTAVKLWKGAIGKRAAFGRLFEGDDLIDKLTERVSRGGGRTLKVDPDEATNYIFNKSSLGFIGKRDLARDLRRLQRVLGGDSPEWNSLRAEAFKRIARAGEGAPENGTPTFSGQNFMKAWNKVKTEDPQITNVLFTPEERRLIDDFAEIAQRVTTPVRGGDNPSNTAITAKKFLGPIMQFLATTGGAGGGAAVGGIPGAAAGAALGPVFKVMRDMIAASKAKSLTSGARPMVEEQLRNPLLPAGTTVGAIAGNRLLNQPAPPQQ